MAMSVPWWEPDIGGNTSYKTCMPNCSLHVGGMATSMRINCPTEFDGAHDFRNDGGTVVPVSQAKPGDVVQYSGGSVAIVISGYGNSATCSHSLFTTQTGYAHNTDNRMERYYEDSIGHTKEDVGRNCNAGFSKPPYSRSGENRCLYTHNINDPGYQLMPINYVFRSGDSPEPQPEPQPGENGYGDDSGEWTQTETVIVPYAISYMDDIYECGAGPIFKTQSGTQDAPRAPDHISTSSDRLNQRGEPFNMYTYERKLTYLKDKSSIWSNGEEKYQGSDYFPLGQQPQYGNGGEGEGNDERE